MNELERVIYTPRKLSVENWVQPRTNILVAAGTQQTVIDRYTHGGLGYITELAVAWVPRGPNKDLLYYNFFVDGNLVEKILRIVGSGNTQGSSTGAPNPYQYNPPLEVIRRVQIVCVNNDTQDFMAECYLGGFTVNRWPNYP